MRSNDCSVQWATCTRIVPPVSQLTVGQNITGMLRT
jgi:hypothetical protein